MARRRELVEFLEPYRGGCHGRSPVARVGARRGRRGRGGPPHARRDLALEPRQGPVAGSRCAPSWCARWRSTTCRATASATRRRSSAGGPIARRPTAATTSSRRPRRRCWPTCSAELTGRSATLAASPANTTYMGVPAVSVALDPNAAVNDLADRFWEGVLERDPIWATILGDDRYDDRWPDLGPDGRAAEEARVTAALAEARESHRPDGLEPEQVITRDLLILVARTSSRRWTRSSTSWRSTTCPACRSWPAEMAQYQPPTRRKRLEKLLARYGRFPDADRPVHRHAATRASPTAGPRPSSRCGKRSSRSTGSWPMTPADQSRRRRWPTSPTTSAGEVAAAVDEHI